MRTERNLKKMNITLHYDDGNTVNIESPEKKIRQGLLMRAGWRIIMAGCYLVFRDRSHWKTIYHI